MVYKVIGLMSGSSLDGLDIAYVHLQEKTSTKQGPKGWDFELVAADCYPYSEEWRGRLGSARGLSAYDYQLLHVEYGRYLGEQLLRFVREKGLEYQVQLVASHGHTVFHDVARRMTAQLGDGAALAATVGVNVVSDLRAMDVALGGQGAPIVPIGEMLLLPQYDFFLNLGGIANVSRGERTREQNPFEGTGDIRSGSPVRRDAEISAELRSDSAVVGQDRNSFVAFDVCPANRVLNTLAELEGQPYDAAGAMAATGTIDNVLLQQLNSLPYYALPFPKSLANDFGTETVLPLVRGAMKEGAAGGGLTTADALRTYTQHIVEQIGSAVRSLAAGSANAGSASAGTDGSTAPRRMLVTGGGAHNTFLVAQLQRELGQSVEIVVPEGGLVDYKEALIMALIGVLRWREANNVLASVTGASRDSIGGAVWIGQEA